MHHDLYRRGILAGSGRVIVDLLDTRRAKARGVVSATVRIICDGKPKAEIVHAAGIGSTSSERTIDVAATYGGLAYGIPRKADTDPSLTPTNVPLSRSTVGLRESPTRDVNVTSALDRSTSSRHSEFQPAMCKESDTEPWRLGVHPLYTYQVLIRRNYHGEELREPAHLN